MSIDKIKPEDYQAISYITRNRFKNGAEDIKKAIHSLEILLEYTNDNI